jgi:dTDP-4-dehydrorhamnose reductase
MRVGIIGASGRLGRALLRAFDGHEVIGWRRADFDIRDHARTADAILAVNPDVLINTAAFHNTDACEDDPAQAFAVNAIAVRNIAQACQKCGALLVHISTDYVFDGRKLEPYEESDRPNPINVYGVSKLAGEHFVAAICERYYIPRVASLFGAGGGASKHSFVEMVLGKAERGEPFVIVDDVVMSPTYAEDAARAVRGLVEAEAPHGIYHVTNAGACSWYAFAVEILRATGVTADLKPTTIEAFAPKAARPRYSALASRALIGAGLESLRPWPEALRAYLEARLAKAPS